MFSCTRAFRLREPIDAWIRSQRGQYQNPIEINHWEYMEKALPIFAAVKKTSKYLEADEYPTGSKALRQMWKLHRALVQTKRGFGKDGSDGAMRGFIDGMVYKLSLVLDDATLFWQWAFLALLDPTGVCVSVCV